MTSLPIHESDAMAAGEAAWRIALLFPPQGSWTERDYLEIDGGRVIEYADGFIEVHDMPTIAHQRIVRYLFQIINNIVNAQRRGEVFFAPLPVHLWDKKFREPDIVYIGNERKLYGEYPDGADLVMEVVSDGAAARRRDLETKVDEYGRAGISEYWIVDPAEEQVIIYGKGNSDQSRYDPPRIFRRGEIVRSTVMTHLILAVDQILDAANTSNG